VGRDELAQIDDFVGVARAEEADLLSLLDLPVHHATYVIAPR